MAPARTKILTFGNVNYRKKLYKNNSFDGSIKIMSLAVCRSKDLEAITKEIYTKIRETKTLKSFFYRAVQLNFRHFLLTFRLRLVFCPLIANTLSPRLVLLDRYLNYKIYDNIKNSFFLFSSLISSKNYFFL